MSLDEFALIPEILKNAQSNHQFCAISKKNNKKSLKVNSLFSLDNKVAFLSFLEKDIFATQ